MLIRLVGAMLVTLGCGGFGVAISVSHRQETAALRSFLYALDVLECELQYRCASLPELCKTVAATGKGVTRLMMQNLALELDKQVSPDAEKCMQAVLGKMPQIPPMTADLFLLFGQSLGRFDLEGQLKGLKSVREECTRLLSVHTADQDKRLRCYQTLGLCAGAALAILFI